MNIDQLLEDIESKLQEDSAPADTKLAEQVEQFLESLDRFEESVLGKTKKSKIDSLLEQILEAKEEDDEDEDLEEGESKEKEEDEEDLEEAESKESEEDEEDLEESIDRLIESALKDLL